MTKRFGDGDATVHAVERFIAADLARQELSTSEESATWLSVFLRDHLDPHMAALISHLSPSHDRARHPQRPVPAPTRT